jgi:hypothetical protein
MEDITDTPGIIHGLQESFMVHINEKELQVRYLSQLQPRDPEPHPISRHNPPDMA